MKILYVGMLEVGQTSRMRMEVLRDLGHSVVGFDAELPWLRVSRLSRRLQQAGCRGPVVNDINRQVLRLAKELCPDLLWAEKQEFLFPETLESLRNQGVKLLHYTPDPYFSLSWKQTRLLDAGLPLYDYVVTSKSYELDAYQKVCSNVIYVPLGFDEAVHRPVLPLDKDARCRFSSDVSFLGGWEPRRETLLTAIAAATGCRLKIWGYAWDHLRDGTFTPRRWWALRRNAGGEPYAIARNELLADSVQGGEVYGDEYIWAISSARISIGFLRKICPERHTTRTFEIPACGSMLLADRSTEHSELFQEGVEADFFSSQEELLEKVKYYLRNESIREKVALNGYRKCHDAGYSYRERVKSVLQALSTAA